MKNSSEEKLFDFEQQLIDVNVGTKLIKVLNKYNYFDLCRAVFCFNSWRYTRPHLQFYLTLNYVLCNIKCEGKCEIKTYAEFEKFIKEITPYYNGTFDDEIIPDFGEIKIPFNKANYSVLMGTGHNLFFPFLESIEVLSNVLKITNEMQEVLAYINSLCQTYGNVELYNSNNYDVQKITIPSENYFNNCISNYNTFNLSDESFLISLSYNTDKSVEKSHFIKSSDGYLSLFNPSIIIDAFDFLCKTKNILDSKNVKVSNCVIYDALYKNFESNPNSDSILFNALVVKDFENKIIYSELPFDFVVLHNNSALLLLNQEKSENKDFNSTINEIKKLINDKAIRLLEPFKDNKCKLYDLTNVEKIEIVTYDNSIQLTSSYLFQERNLICFNLYDLVSIIYEANNIEDIINFCQFIQLTKRTTIMSPIAYSGYATLFYAWLKQNEEIIPGAYDVCNIITDVYMLEWYIFEKYMDLNKWYPIKIYDEMFYNPFSWIIKEEKLGFRRLISNSVYGFGGCFRKVNDSYIFIAFNLGFEKSDDEWYKRNETIILIEELIERNLLELEKILIKSGIFNFKNLQLTYMPKHYAEKADKDGFLKENRKYVFSDMYIQNDKILIRFTVNEDKVFEDILEAKDRRVECEFMKELLMPLRRVINFDDIENYLESTKNLKKNIETMAMELDYVFSNKNLGLWPSDKMFVKVRKVIAIACKEFGIKTGTYKPSETTDVIRNIQKRIIPIFEKKISEYNQIDLHKELISIISFYLHKKKIEMKRYNIKDSKNLTESAKSHTEENAINAREESKGRIRDLYFLVDTNLAINERAIKINNIEQDDIEYLIAFAHILMELQDCSDNAYYNLFGANINIEDDFIIETNFSEEYLKSAKQRNARIYENLDYKPELTEDNEMFKKCLESFNKDTGVHLECIIQICKYLAKEFSATFNKQSIPDVYVIKKQDLISDYESILMDCSEESKLNYSNALNYLIIEKNRIKQIDGKFNEFVPVWERERRNERFEVKPIVEDGENIIFAPIIMYELSQLWLSGTLEFYPPYEINLVNYRKQLDKWKSLCESKMEQDLYDLFNAYKYITFKNVFLHKLDKEHHHPQELGDYDIISIDMDRKVIWNIESKFLTKVGSLKEYYNHQTSFFINDKKDEKFEKRIKYLSEHKDEILKVFGIKNSNNFTVKNFMVTNKVFVADVKKVEFAIITFDELKKMLSILNETIN